MNTSEQNTTSNPSETTHYAKRFISNIANKDYKEAGISLQDMVEAKLKERIKNTLAPKN